MSTPGCCEGTRQTGWGSQWWRTPTKWGAQKSTLNNTSSPIDSIDASNPGHTSKIASRKSSWDRHDVNTSLPSWAHFPKADPWLRHRDQSFAGPDPEAAFGYGNLKNFQNRWSWLFERLQLKSMCSFEFVNVIIEIDRTDNALKLCIAIWLKVVTTVGPTGRR